MTREKAELDHQKTQSSLERALQTSEDRNKDYSLQVEQLRDKVDKLMHQV